MGYRAPSAEDVYRYVFRLDSYNRSLTDGFGLSIIFVSDNSSVCRDLIGRYFVDLCHRTADRIRIIFFSELPESYFEDIARQMNSNSYSAKRLRENGILGQVIEANSHRPIDIPQIELFDSFLEALRFRDYNEVDWLLSRISHVLGPRYADALYRLVREHQYGDAQNVERRVRELIVELQNPKLRSRQDRFRRMYDDHWRDITPASIMPIDSPERTRDLSFDTKNNTAMPGVGESMRFAARLGIGRYVPCFVFFTDVGQLSVDVFPVGQLSADETYEQLRAWIDSFYEENYVSVDKWKQVEKDITAFTNSINQPLTKFKNWISQGEELWDELRSVAQVIVKLNTSLSKPEVRKSVIDQLNSSSQRCRQILSEYRASLEKIPFKIDRHKLRQEHLRSIINNLNTASDFAQIYSELSCAARKSLKPTELIDLRQQIKFMESENHRLRLLSLPEAEVELEIEKIALKCRDEVLTAFSKKLQVQEEPDFSKEEATADSNCLLRVRKLRDKIEQELTELANSAYNPDNSPLLVETKNIARFLKVLEEYDCTVNNLIYPYQRDRKVKSIQLPAPFPQIFELKIPEELNRLDQRSKELKELLGENILNSKSGATLLQDVQKRYSTITPKARLASELTAIMRKAEVSRENAECSDLVVKDNLEEKLYGLNNDELTILSNSVAKLNFEAGNREDIIDVILSIVGLIPARELAIHRQYATRPINVEVNTVSEQSKNVEIEMNFHAPVTGATGKNDGVININISAHQKQTLAEAATEIQQLLKQLEETNPSATESEQVAYVDVEVQPSLKQRTIAALKAGGETAIDEFFLENKYLKVGKAVVKAWIQPSS